MKIKTKPARNKQADSLPFVQHVINGIEEKKGNEIACLDLRKISNAPCDFFVICEGTSRTHVQAIAGSVEEILKKETGGRPWHVEGLQNAEWVLMDYVDVVVHIFQPHVRQHFSLEDMWADAVVTTLPGQTPAKQEVVAAPPVQKKKTAAKPKAAKTTKAKKVPAKKKTAAKKIVTAKKKTTAKKPAIKKPAAKKAKRKK